MSGQEECPHGDDAATCPPCLRTRRPDLTERPKVEPLFTFTARYDGDCPGCNLPISPGQQVTKWSDERTRHEGCKP